MLTTKNRSLLLSMAVAYAGIVVGLGESPELKDEVTVGGVAVSVVLERLGATMEHGVSRSRLSLYSQHFDRIDHNHDGVHSKTEFIEDGSYLNARSRRGIFVASDRNRDGEVSKAEYILNRIITDEAKKIVEALDLNEDGRILRTEFLQGTRQPLMSDELAASVYAAFDGNKDGEIVIPEYLRIWGAWARADGKSASLRIGSLIE